MSGVPKQIAATVDRLGRAIADRDFDEVCDKLFTAAARKRAGGSECATQMTAAAEGVRNPAIEIRGIDVQGNRATVKVATTAEGQARLDRHARAPPAGGALAHRVAASSGWVKLE